MRPAVLMSLIVVTTGVDTLSADHSTLPQRWQLVFATFEENTSQNWEGVISSLAPQVAEPSVDLISNSF